MSILVEMKPQEAQEPGYILHTKKWVEQFVIHLALCPFAAKPFIEDKIRYVLSEASDVKPFLEHFIQEVQFLKESVETSTTLVIIPDLDDSFIDYLDVYELAERLMSQMKFMEDFQLASFHPKYQFEGTDIHELSNYTNRSPHAIIHILRTEEVEGAIKMHPDTEKIPGQNIEMMEKLGKEELIARLNEIKDKKT